VSFVDAVPIEPVIEVRADCSDRARATAALADALAVARGPRRSSKPDAMWRVTVRVTSGAHNARSADAQIVDDDGRVVAERTVADKSGGTCLALARAVGAWTQIVLDDELARAKDEAAKPPEPPSKTTTTLAANVPDPDAPKPAPAPAPEVTPIEIGTMVLIRNSSGTSGVAGASPFVVIGVSGQWLLRPAGIIAASSNEQLYGGRLDFCRRIPGNYIERRGIEIDACAGVDSGAAVPDKGTKNALRLSTGPAFTIRGELAAGLALELRGMAGFNISQQAAGNNEAPPPVVASAEVGASVRFR
jgi:hypothetical protein